MNLRGEWTTTLASVWVFGKFSSGGLRRRPQDQCLWETLEERQAKLPFEGSKFVREQSEWNHITDWFECNFYLPFFFTDQSHKHKQSEKMAKVMMMTTVILLHCSLVLAEGQTLPWQKKPLSWRVRWSTGAPGLITRKDRAGRLHTADTVDKPGHRKMEIITPTGGDGCY